MARHKNFKRFIKRLKRLRQKSVPQCFSKLLSKNDLSQIFDFFNITKTQMKIIDSLSIQADVKIKCLHELMQYSQDRILYLPLENNNKQLRIDKSVWCLDTSKLEAFKLPSDNCSILFEGFKDQAIMFEDNHYFPKEGSGFKPKVKNNKFGVNCDKQKMIKVNKNLIFSPLRDFLSHKANSLDKLCYRFHKFDFASKQRYISVINKPK